jgi:hypothetical protein
MKQGSGCIYIFHTEKTTYFKTKIPKETTSFSLTWMYVTGAPILVLENKILSEKYILNKLGYELKPVFRVRVHCFLGLPDPDSYL